MCVCVGCVMLVLTVVYSCFQITQCVGCVMLVLTVVYSCFQITQLKVLHEEKLRGLMPVNIKQVHQPKLFLSYASISYLAIQPVNA